MQDRRQIINNYNWIISKMTEKMYQLCGENELKSFMMELGTEAMFKGIYEDPEIHNTLNTMSQELMLNY